MLRKEWNREEAEWAKFGRWTRWWVWYVAGGVAVAALRTLFG